MLENREGQQVPNVTFKVIEKGSWKEITSDDLFKNQKVILFALPGAYTPTCSSTHLPRYNDLYEKFKDLGVDRIICLSVNDTFVMNAWSADQEAENLDLIPDGNGEFSEKMGLLVDKSAIGFGKRTWRYSMYVENGTIKKMFIEPEKDGDPFEVSDADTMFSYLNPNGNKVEEIVLFSKEGCPHCARAKDLLKSKSMPFQEVKGVRTLALRAMGGAGTYPLIFVNGEKIGGADDLQKKFGN